MGGIFSALKEKRPRIGLIWILLIAVVGVVLLLFGGNGGGRADNGGEVTTDRLTEQEMEAYASAMEEKIRTLCESVSGISGVRVAVTLASGYEYVYAKEGESATSGDKVSTSYHYLTVGSGADEKTVYLASRAPTVAGIGIVCRGGGDPTRKRELLLLISAAFGVPSNRIYITEGG